MFNFWNWKFNPFTQIFNPANFVGEQHIVAYDEDANAYGIRLNNLIELQGSLPFNTNINYSIHEDVTGGAKLTETPRTNPPDAGQFRVDYSANTYFSTSFIEFNSADDGLAVIVNYRQLGTVVKARYQLLSSIIFPANVGIEGNLDVTDNITVGIDLTVAANSQIDGNENVDGNFSVSGNTQLSGDVDLGISTGSSIRASLNRIQDVADPEQDQDAVTFKIIRDQNKYLVGWTEKAKPENLVYSHFIYGGTTFVGVSKSGTSRVVRSTDDGVTWLGATAAEANNWERLAFGNSVFVAVSSTGTNRTMRSTNAGSSWSAVAAAEANTWQGLAFGNSVFVAVSSDGTNRTMRSTNDGVSWSAVAAAEANSWRAVAYGNSVFVAVASSGTNRTMRSTNDGVSWSAVAAASANSWSGIAFGGGVFIAVAEDTGFIANVIMRSIDDGASWTSIKVGGVMTAPSISFVDSAFLIWSDDCIIQSLDLGLTWTRVPIGNVDINAFAFSGTTTAMAGSNIMVNAGF
jgi:hypothetical protein